MTYQEAEAYILSIPKFTEKNSRAHTQLFLKRLCADGDGRKIIHVAGTNGKGSVCAYLQAMLLAEGKTVGGFISPHLVKMNERIRINGEEVSDEIFLASFHRVYDTVQEMEAEGIPHPTFFEFLFGMGMDIFTRSKVEYIVLETGLGGRLDATNAIEHPALTVLTSISLDHTVILGDTVQKIAAEKAGIIKEGVTVIFDGNSEEASEIIEAQAASLHAPCRKITKDAYEIKRITAKDIAFLSTDAYYKNTVWELCGPAVYQAANAMLALAAMKHLAGENGHPGIWKEALAKIRWEGRMEEILPGVFLDGAHNRGAIEAFLETLRKMGRRGRRVILFSAVEDKDYEYMIRMLAKESDADVFVLTKIQDKRATDVEALKAAFETYTDCPVIAREDVESAFRRAYEEKGEDGELFCVGSLYLVGMLKELLGGRKDA